MTFNSFRSFLQTYGINGYRCLGVLYYGYRCSNLKTEGWMGNVGEFVGFKHPVEWVAAGTEDLSPEPVPGHPLVTVRS